MESMRRIGVFIKSSFPVGKGVLEGIRGYGRAQGGWKLAVAEGAQFRWFNELAGELDGVLTWVHDQEFASALEAWGKPYVQVISASGAPNSRFPGVECDNRGVGRAGAEHLMNLGFRRLAFFGFTDYPFSLARQEGFLEAATRGGCTCLVNQINPNTMKWASIWKAVAEWVSSLPKPIGVMAAKDPLGVEVLTACKDLGIRVPAQVAVVGVGNETEVCQGAFPPLSSVDQDLQGMGFRAAALLEDLLSGKSVPGGRILVPPAEVVGRASTDTLLTADPEVAKALHYIRQHACDPMQVKDILTAVPLSRRSLELRFAQVLGRSPHEEIRRLQLQQVTRLLAQPNLPLEQVARTAGFSSDVEMIKIFRRERGMTPGEYRRRWAPAAAAPRRVPRKAPV